MEMWIQADLILFIATVITAYKMFIRIILLVTCDISGSHGSEYGDESLLGTM
jgi:hypothetical protein